MSFGPTISRSLPFWDQMGSQKTLLSVYSCHRMSFAHRGTDTVSSDRPITLWFVAQCTLHEINNFKRNTLVGLYFNNQSYKANRVNTKTNIIILTPMLSSMTTKAVNAICLQYCFRYFNVSNSWNCDTYKMIWAQSIHNNYMVLAWERVPYHWHFVWGIHRWLVRRQMRSCDAFWVACLNKRSYKQSSCRWFELEINQKSRIVYSNICI